MFHDWGGGNPKVADKHTTNPTTSEAMTGGLLSTSAGNFL